MTRSRHQTLRTVAALALVGLTTSGCSLSFSGMWDSIVAFFEGGDSEVKVASETPQTKMLATGTHCVKEGKYLLLTPAFCARVGGVMVSSGEEAALAGQLNAAAVASVRPQPVQPTAHATPMSIRSTQPAPAPVQPIARTAPANTAAALASRSVQPASTVRPSPALGLPAPTAAASGGGNSVTVRATLQIQERASAGLQAQPGDYKPDDYKAGLPAHLTARPMNQAPAQQPAAGRIASRSSAEQQQTPGAGQAYPYPTSTGVPQQRGAFAPAPVMEMQDGQVFRNTSPAPTQQTAKPYRILQQPQATPLRPVPVESADPRSAPANPIPPSAFNGYGQQSGGGNTEIWRPNTLGGLSAKGFRNLGSSQQGLGLYGGTNSGY